MTVYIEAESSGRYNWRVQVGNGRGARIKSRHRYKRRAKSKAKQLARQRGDQLKERMQAGYLRTVASY
jgi:hypothetical protein